MTQSFVVVRAANGDPYKIGSACSEYQAPHKKKITDRTPLIFGHHNPVGAGEACDLLTLLFKGKIKRSQAAPAPTGGYAHQGR
jgi:hypothetical protein